MEKHPFFTGIWPSPPLHRGTQGPQVSRPWWQAQLGRKISELQKLGSWPFPVTMVVPRYQLPTIQTRLTSLKALCLKKDQRKADTVMWRWTRKMWESCNSKLQKKKSIVWKLYFFKVKNFNKIRNGCSLHREQKENTKICKTLTNEHFITHSHWVLWMGLPWSMFQKDQVNNSNSAFNLINRLISGGCQIGLIGLIGQGGPGGPGGGQGSQGG